MKRDLREKKSCGDCQVPPGFLHQSGCDQEQCSGCGRQAIGCECLRSDVEALPRLPWDGFSSGVRDCQKLGLYAKMVKGWWVPTLPGDPDAKEDLNCLMGQGVWDKASACFVSVD